MTQPSTHRARAFLLLAAAAIAFAASAQQPTAAPLTFEVATVKPSDKPGKFPWNEQPSADGMSWTNVSLQYLVREAYGVTDDKRWSGGPAWLDTQRFDIVAKFDASTAPNPPVSQRMQALQKLLADRFALKLHRESKDFPIFNLVVGKGGPKFQQSKPDAKSETAIPGMCTVLISRAGVTKRQGCSMATLAGILRYSTGRTVLDKTGLSGNYDYELHWTPEDATPEEAVKYSGPSIFNAVEQQLGLKLEPATAPLDVLVIDFAEQPTAN